MGVFDTLINTRKSAVVPSTADPIYQRMEQQLGAVPEPETGYAAGGFRALARGITGMSREVGDMLQYNDTPGQENIVNRVGRWMSDTGQTYQDKISRPAPGSSEVKRSVFEAVENLPVSLWYSVPSIVGALAGTTVGPGGTVAGSVAGQGLSSALMFRASAQRAYEDIMQANPGIDPARAMEAAKKVGHANWIGESVSNIPEAIAFSMLPGGKAISGGVKALIKPGVKTLARNLGISAASEQLGENWTSYQETKAMNEVLPADKQQSPWEAVKQTIGPTAVMSLIMGGAGTGAQVLRSRGTANALQDPTTDLKSRHLAMLEVATRLNEIDPKQAENWRKNAATALLTGSPIPLDDTFLQDPKIFHQQLMDDAEQLQRSTFPNAPYPGMVPGAASPAASPFDTSIVDPSLGVVPDRTPRSPITGLAINDFGFEAPENAPVPISPITGKPVSNAVFMPDLTAQRLRLNRLLGLEAATAPGSAATPAASPFDTSLVDPTTGQVRIFSKPTPTPAPAVSSTPASAPFDTSLVDQTAGTAQLPVNPITGLPYRPVPLSGTGSEVFTPGVSPITGKLVQDAIPMESITRELQRLESTKLETISPQNILDEVNQNQAYQRNKSGKGFTTTSDFTALMKERHPALAGIAKGDLVSALNKMVKGGKPTEKQQATVDQITEYLDETNTRIQEEMKANAERAAALRQQQVAAQQEVQQERPIEDGEVVDDSFDFGKDEGYIQDPEEVQFSMKENDDATTAREIAQTLQGEQGKTIDPARLSFSEHSELSTIGRAFGVTVRLYDYKGKENLGEGFVLGSDPKTVYVNKKAASPALTVLGHELTHQLVKNDIDLFIELVTYLKGEIELGRYAQYAATLRNIPAYNNLNNDALFVEVVGNIVGAQFGKTSFWERMAQKEPSLFSKLIGIAKSFLRSAKESINIFNASENVVRDIEKVEAVVASVFAKYARKAQEGTYQEGPKDSSIHFAFNGTEFLRPAVVRGGVVKVAPVGATHGDAERVVVSKIPSGLADFTGFTTPDGQTLTRKEANEWLKVNRPEVYRALDKTTKQNGLESMAYAHAEGLKDTANDLADRFMREQFGVYSTKESKSEPLTKQRVQAAFKGQKVVETPEGFVVTLPNGFQIRVEKTGEISFNTQKAEEALGRKLLPGEAPVAAWKKFPFEGLIQLTERGMGELNHEVFHAAMSLALSKGERTKVLNQIKKANPGISDKQAEEIAAQEYNEWMNAEQLKPNTLWQKIKDFAMRLKDLVFTSKEGVYRKVGSGKVWGKSEVESVFGNVRMQAGLLVAEKPTDVDPSAASYSFLNNIGKTLTQAQEKLAQSPVLDQAIAFLAPMNRLIDIMLSRKDLAPIRSSIKTLGEWMQKQRTFQDDLLSDAKKIFDRALDTATGGRKIGHDPALVNQLHAMMSKMTLWGIDPSGTTGDKFGNEGTWEMSGMKDSTGLTLDEAKKAVAAQWAKVPSAMQKSIVEMLKANQRALALQKKVNLAVIESLDITPETKAKLVENIKKRFDGMSGPYFPLSRYGKYVVSIKGDDGKKLWDSRFDSQGDALKFLAMVEKDPKAFLEAQGLANAATYQGFATSIDAVNPITRRQQYIPEAFLNRIKAAADSAGTIDLRKELRAIYRDAKKEEDANPGTYSPDVLQQVYDAAHAKTYEEANTAMAKLTTMVSTAQEEQDLLKEVTSSIDGAGFRADIADRLKDDFEEIWFAALPETSVLKHLMKRKGILGYDQNMTRSFLTYHQKHARAMAFMKYGTKVNRELANIDKKAKEEDLNNESKLSIQNFAGMIRDHQNYMMSEKVSELVKKATKLSFAWYLSSPSAFLVQSSQPFTMAQPFLAARFGYSKAMGAINRAYGQQIKGEWTDAKLQEWNEQNRKLIEQIKDLDDEGKTKDLNVRVKGMEMRDIERLAIAVSPSLNISLSHEAMELIASGKPNDLELMKKIGTFMSVSETTSRKAGFLAAFRLKYNQTGDFAAAHKFATDMLNDVFFDYSSQNRPKLLTGNMGRFFGQFRVFQVQSLFKIGKLFHDAIGTNATLSAEEKKTARKELGFLLFNNFSLAGATGMPLMGSAVFLTNIVMNLFGDDDEPWDTEMEMSKMLREQLGEGVGTAAAKGWLPSLLGLDIAKRIGMGSIGNLFQSSPPEGKRGADLAGWYAMNAMGPAFNAVVTTPLRGAEAWQKGDWTDAARAGLPKPMADLVKAYQMFSEGQVTASGQTLKQAEDFNPYQVVMAALGVNPMEMSLAAEDYRMVTSYSTAISDRRTRLLKDFVRAALSDDYDAQEEAKDAISRFNEKMPKFAFKASDLANGLKDGLKKRRGELSKKQRAVQDYIGGEGNG